MTNDQRTAAETAAIRGREALTQAEALAPAGVCTQWVQLARVQFESLAAILATTTTTTTEPRA